MTLLFLSSLGKPVEVLVDHASCSAIQGGTAPLDATAPASIGGIPVIASLSALAVLFAHRQTAAPFQVDP